MNIFDELIEKINIKKMPLCVGLDPHIDLIPEMYFDFQNTKNDFLKYSIAIKNFIKKVIDEVHFYVPAVKFQSAFYEIYGDYGFKILAELIDYAKNKDLIVILDVKRGDIGSTAKAYAKAYLSDYFFKPDIITVNPYLGEDGLNPFIEYCKKYNKGIFVLAKTSNRSSYQIQDLLIDDKPVFELIAQIVSNLGINTEGKYGFKIAGIVAGATFPAQLKLLREKFKDLFLLIPGLHSQGGKLSDIKNIFIKNKVGAIINSSRGILFAYKKYNLSSENHIEATLKELKSIKYEFKEVFKE